MRNIGFNLMGRAKRRVDFQLIIESFAFVFSVIILAIGCALFDGKIYAGDAGAYTAAVIFAIFEFGCCVAMLALWVSLYNNLKVIEVIRRLMAWALAVYGLILAFIACIIIVDILYFGGLVQSLGDVGWKAINGLVMAFTTIGLIISIVTCVMVHSAANRVNEVKEEIKEEILA